MSSRTELTVFGVILAVLPLLVQAAPVDVDGDGTVGPLEIIDLSLHWKGPAYPITWQVNGTSIFYNGGNVGIGTTTPDTKLHVADGRIRVKDTATGNRWDLFQTSAGNLFKIEQNAAFSNFAIVGGADGRVGIGTDTPATGTKLNVVTNAASNWAIRGDGPNGSGVVGTSASGSNAATAGLNSGANGIGVYGEANLGSLPNGVYGKSTNGIGAYGLGTIGTGVKGVSNSNLGVQGVSSSSSGVEGRSDSSEGVYGYSANSIGVFGSTGGSDPDDAGVVAQAGGPNSSALRVEGFAFFRSDAYIRGSVDIDGDLVVGGGIINKSTFQIDHPLDPENKVLSHSSVESSEMKNIYDGNVVLDDKGEAEINLPEWFEALNKDFRYQLTPIGGPGTNLHIAQEIVSGRFRIGGGSPGLKVSWQVTGIRNDPYAKAHPLEVEKAKPKEDRGKYLSPELYGQSKEMGINYRPELEPPSEVVLKAEQKKERQD